MKEIEYSKNFIKHFKERIKGYPNLEKRFAERVNLFIKDRRSPVLRDHSLQGNKLMLRSFSITGDIRVIYMESEKSFQFMDIGSHNQVY